MEGTEESFPLCAVPKYCGAGTFLNLTSIAHSKFRAALWTNATSKTASKMTYTYYSTAVKAAVHVAHAKHEQRFSQAIRKEVRNVMNHLLTAVESSAREKTSAVAVVTESEGFQLHLSSRNSTGYKGVERHATQSCPERPFRVVRYAHGTRETITFETAVEAAVAYARHELSNVVRRTVNDLIDAVERTARHSAPVVTPVRRSMRSAPSQRSSADDIDMVEEWAQCDLCSKWVVLPDGARVPSKEERWLCPRCATPTDTEAGPSTSTQGLLESTTSQMPVTGRKQAVATREAAVAKREATVAKREATVATWVAMREAEVKAAVAKREAEVKAAIAKREAAVAKREAEVKAREDALSLCSLNPAFAALTRLRAERAELTQPRMRSVRCGTCDGCKRDDCGECRNCVDKPKFGGSGQRKSGCVHKLCRQPRAVEALAPPPAARSAPLPAVLPPAFTPIPPPPPPPPLSARAPPQDPSALSATVDANADARTAGVYATTADPPLPAAAVP